MLRLLAQREEGYGDIAALTGQSVEEVRAKVAVALGGARRDPPPAPAPERLRGGPEPEASEPAPQTPKPAAAGPEARRAEAAGRAAGGAGTGGR